MSIEQKIVIAALVIGMPIILVLLTLCIKEFILIFKAIRDASE